jgi:hypothetical protein
MESGREEEAVVAYTRPMAIVVRLTNKGWTHTKLVWQESRSIQGIGKRARILESQEDYKLLFSCEASPTVDQCQHSECLDV